jgi:putative holliday junction resolvase
VRVLGIDHGCSRTGLALSDPRGVICSPLATLRTKDEGHLIERIAGIVGEHGVALVVLGLPRPLSGGTNAQLQSVLRFKARLEGELTVPVVAWDERFTSKLADSGRRSADQDSVAAAYMLQNYLDSRTHATGDEEIHERQAV